jgi:dienelactone hydrolase
MLKNLLVAPLTLFITMAAFAQQNKLIKYKDFVFENVSVQKNIVYNNLLKEGVKKKYYLFDFYEPGSDTALQRPLIIWIHGGGFKFGNKNSAGTPLWSKSFARRGYVCAAVNYRLSKKKPLAKFPDLAEGCYDGIEDVKTAVAFLKKNYAQYKIDTNRIILAGNSAGGMIALQAVYSNAEELQKLFTNKDTGSSDIVINPMKIVAVINFWGALFNTTWLNNTRIPIVSAQGTNDRIVPFDHKTIPMYGSLAIHKKADSLKIPNALKAFEGYGHELHKHFLPILTSAGTKKRWMQADQFAADFLYEELFR